MQLDWHRSFPSGFPRAQGRLSDSQPACQWVELWVGIVGGCVPAINQISGGMTLATGL